MDQDPKDGAEFENVEIDISDKSLDLIPDDEPEEEAPEEEAEGDKPEATEVVTPAPEVTVDEDLIELADGTKVTAKELVSGYLRQSDYTKKTQALAEERKRLDATIDKFNPNAAPMREQPTDALKPKYKPEQLHELKTVLNELGYVSKEELNQQSEKKQREGIINGFFAQHPEYAAENDPGDLKISALRAELALFNHSDISVLPKALQKAHEAVAPSFGLDKERETQIAAKLKGKSASIGSGGGQKSPAPSGSQQRYTRAQIQVMQEMGVYDGEQPID